MLTKGLIDQPIKDLFGGPHIIQTPKKDNRAPAVGTYLADLWNVTLIVTYLIQEMLLYRIT